MACKICGGYWCTECFHSIEEQERWEREQDEQMDEYFNDPEEKQKHEIERNIA